MKISTKGRYALRLMLDLALQDPAVFVNIKSISKRQEISEKYLEQIITQLSRRKLVQSARGAQGGYKLSKEPKDYTIGEILRATEGSLAPVTCLEDGHAVCDRAAACATLDLWRELQDAINKIVDSKTLQDLVDKQKKKELVLNKKKNVG
jgi:Rrf2 family cysteine metabolism transcriptional repressor